jgi:hypothetical protein
MEVGRYKGSGKGAGCGGGEGVGSKWGGWKVQGLEVVRV